MSLDGDNTNSRSEGPVLDVSSVRSSAGSGSKNVPIWKKLAYAIGAMPYAMCSTIINLYFSIFLLEAVLVS